jgi:hypothetical protein
MGKFDRRTLVIATLVPIEVLALVGGALHHLPKHGGWVVGCSLVILGAVFGLRAVLLPVAACITLLIAGQMQCSTQEHCAEAFIWLYLAPSFRSPPSVARSLAGS